MRRGVSLLASGGNEYKPDDQAREMAPLESMKGTETLSKVKNWPEQLASEYLKETWILKLAWDKNILFQRPETEQAFRR